MEKSTKFAIQYLITIFITQNISFTGYQNMFLVLIKQSRLGAFTRTKWAELLKAAAEFLMIWEETERKAKGKDLTSVCEELIIKNISSLAVLTSAMVAQRRGPSTTQYLCFSASTEKKWDGGTKRDATRRNGRVTAEVKFHKNSHS